MWSPSFSAESLVQPSVLRANRRRLFDAMAVPVYGALALAVLIVALALASGRFDIDRGLLDDGIASTVFFLMIAYAMRWLGFERLATGVEMMMLSAIIPIAMAFCSLVLASSAWPMRDAELAAIDVGLLGFDRQAVVATARRLPWLMMVSGWVYRSAAMTPYLLLVAMIARRQLRSAWVVMSALVNDGIWVGLPQRGDDTLPAARRDDRSSPTAIGMGRDVCTDRDGCGCNFHHGLGSGVRYPALCISLCGHIHRGQKW